MDGGCAPCTWRRTTDACAWCVHAAERRDAHGRPQIACDRRVMKSSRSVSAVAAPHCDRGSRLAHDHEIGVAVEAAATGGATIGRISGDIDVLAAPSFALALADLAQDDAALVIDMTGVDFVGTSALSVLSTFAESARQRHMTWALAGNRAVLRPIQATGLDTKIPACDSVRKALDWIDARGHA